MSWIKKEKLFFNKSNVIKKYTLQGWILEWRHFDQIYTKLWTRSPTKLEIELWMSEICEYQKLSTLKTEDLIKFKPKILNFSAPAFGFLLHEGLGHRLESDDFNALPRWCKNKNLNFEVFDTPGKPQWWGYCPLDDLNIKGKPVKLLFKNNETPKSSWINKKSGNLRSTSAYWHPIIRQRNLETHLISNRKPALFKKSKIDILEIGEGELCGENIILKVTRSTVKFTHSKNIFRLHPFVIELKLTEIPKFKAYGRRVLYHVPGGCSKGLQRGLPISFNCHSAWASLKNLDYQIVF